MRRTTRLVLVPSVLATAAMLAATAAHAQYTAYGITTTAAGPQQLVRFSTSAPGVVTALGLTGVDLVGIDFRPATRTLYGFTGTGIYTLNVTTGLATFVATSSTPATAPIGFDFNPVPDRIRIVDAVGPQTNLRVNPTTGAATVDGAYAYGAGDPFAGQSAVFSGVGYTNSDADPATGTMLFGIDDARGNLVRIAQPNGGDVFTVGSLGLAGGSLAVNGFDIVLAGGSNVAFLAALGTNAAATSSLYAVNLGTGATTLLGDVGSAGGIQGLAIAAVPEPGTYLLVATGLVAVAGVARRRRAAS